ncbi:MAG: RNA-binding S4 domain-containing protein [Candidatus Coatesbacteria bacterium]|nr:RNA-binding S4 domain-containing protein [Candidatus Coatesbacteria bacterium]
MRLDLFLKVSCLAKRRAFAKELCDEGCVKINGNLAKAGREVGVGDEIEIRKRGQITRLRVIELPQKSINKNRAKECYEIIQGSDTSLELSE